MLAIQSDRNAIIQKKELEQAQAAINRMYRKGWEVKGKTGESGSITTDGILQVANMQKFFKEHSDGFHTAEAKGIWKEYTESYYRMDSYYRLFHLSFQKSLETSNILLDDLFKQVVDKVEGLYTHWFLELLCDKYY